MMNHERIVAHFYESAELHTHLATELAEPIAQAVECMFIALSNGNRIFACGNGTCATNCQHFAAQLVGRFARERLPLPVMALTADGAMLSALGNEYGLKDTFSRQIRAFGQCGDVLLAVSTSGNCANVAAAVETALERDMRVVALTGKEGGALVRLQDADEIIIHVPHHQAARVDELHLLVMHCLCDGLDVALFGEEEHA